MGGVIYTGRALIKFDLTPLLNMSISKVELCLYPYECFDMESMWDYDMRNGPKTLYAVTTAWDDATATWKAPWTNEGGDYEQQTVIAQSGADTTVKRWEQFDVTSAVKSWVASPSSNNGLIIIFDDYTRRGIMMYSSESNETDKRPKLVVNPGVTGAYAEADAAVRPQISLSRAGNSLRLQLPAAGGWETATVYGLDGRTIASVRMQANMDACRINGSFARGAYVVRLQGKNTALVKRFILAE